MKTLLATLLLSVALVTGIAGCGGDDATSSETQESSSTTTAEGGGDATTSTGPLKPEAPKVVIGNYEPEGPFSGIAGRAGDKKPLFKPSGQPTPDKTVFRELEVGTGPAAERGDEVSIYYVGAIFDTGEIQVYGWPPSTTSVVDLGAGLYGKSWEKTIEGMKAGGIRQVIVPSSEFAGGQPVEYVILVTDLQPKSEK